MLEGIKSVESIKGSIEIILEVIREIFKADVCALFLIMEDMHEDERLEIFEQRLNSIKNNYDTREKIMPKWLAEYWAKYNGSRENLRGLLNEIDILKFCFKEVQNPLITKKELYPERNGRIWQYDYKNRPPKWVIFKKYTQKEPQKSILFEGMTAYSIRAKRELFHATSFEIEAYPCVTHLQSEKGMSLRCKMIVFLHLKDPTNGKIIGLLKIENYEDRENERPKFSENSEETKEVRKYLPLIETLIKESKKFCDEYSYEKLYRGIKLLELLKNVTPQEGSLNKNIYSYTHHLFCVLYRKEYVGYEEIMTRVTKYADDLAEELSISPKEFFKRLLERRRQHEELMLYKTEGYRDHFMHQFHVFVTGYIILNHIGLHEICERVNESVKYVLPSLEPKLELKEELKEENILRIWFLTSFMHDAAYVFERFGKGMAHFLKKEWGYPFAVKLEELGLQLLDKSMPFSKYLSMMLGFFKCAKSTNQDVLIHYLDSIIKMDDHATLSALWLIEKFARGRTTSPRIAECYLSALAISFHNPNIFIKLKEEPESGISFESFPIPFMLAFCDTVQIWGRAREIQEDVHPELLDIEFKGKEIRVKLFYKTPYPEKIPTRDETRKRLVQDKDVFFRSFVFKFIIEFYGGKEYSPALTPIDTVSFKYSAI